MKSTHKMNCPVNIKLLASACGNFLEIRSLNLKHENHELSLKAFEHLPQNRKLAPCERAEAEALIKLGCDKKKLQNKIAIETSKHPTLKDLTNIRSAMKKDDENDLAKVVSLLEKKYRATVSVLRDQDNNFKGLYFSTEDMRNSMSSWPEIILIDGTYKLLAQDFTLMLLLVEDSNGLSEIVGVCLIVHEDRETFEWFLGCFKSENEMACSKIECFMADKDLLERNVLKEIFGVPVYICLFHTLKTFSRQITTDRIGSSNPMKRQEILKLLQDLVYSSSDEDYNEKYEKFCETVPERVLEYYNDNWHPIKQEWTVYSMTHGNFENRTNNRLESVNNKIKQVVPKRSTLEGFINHFFEWLNSHKYETDHKAAQHVLKRPVIIFAPNTCEDRYLRYLTSFAFRYVIESIDRSKSINAEDVNKDTTDEAFVVKCSKGTVKATLINCQCRFWISMRLPCKHIFAIRKLQDCPLFDENLIDLRWTREFYLQSQRTFRSKSNLSTPSSSPAPVVTETKPRRALTLTEKRKRASLITSSLVTLASLSVSAQFLCKIQVLKDIERFWREGFQVTVEKIETRSSGSIAPSTSADSEDECNSTSDCNTRPLETISESSEDADFDVSSLDCELINKVLDWDDEFNLTDLTKILQTTSSSRHNRMIDMEDILTPPPEPQETPIFCTAGALTMTSEDQLVVSLCENGESSVESAPVRMANMDIETSTISQIDGALKTTAEAQLVVGLCENGASSVEVAPVRLANMDIENSTISQIDGALKTTAEVQAVVDLYDNGEKSTEASPVRRANTDMNFATRDSSTESRTAVASNTIAVVQSVTPVKRNEANSLTEAEPAATSSLIFDNRSDSHESSDILKQIIMPGPIRVRGRPKGAVLTAIGLKRTRTAASTDRKSLRTRNSEKAPIQFTKRSTKDQVGIIFGWFVSKDIIPAVLSGKYIVQESDMEVKPELINNAILDKQVALHLLQNYMDDDAFDSIIDTIETKRKNVVWECTVCTAKLEDRTVICDACLTWYHFTCVGLKRAPRKSVWFCPTCEDK